MLLALVLLAGAGRAVHPLYADSPPRVTMLQLIQEQLHALRLDADLVPTCNAIASVAADTAATVVPDVSSTVELTIAGVEVSAARPYCNAWSFGGFELATSFGKQGPPESGLPVAVPPPGVEGRFIWPVESRRISTVFAPSHQAIDIDEWPAGGQPVRAAADGVVTYAGGQACCSYGLYVIVQHAGGFASLYAHFSRLTVSPGQVVRQGQELGGSGCTGSCTGPHLHFAIYFHGAPLDPLTVLPAGAQIE